jgi:hypothetical protein
MPTNTISISNLSIVQVRLVEVRDTGYINVNGRHFTLKVGSNIDITPSLSDGINIITLFVNTYSIRDNPLRLLERKFKWLGRFELYVDGAIAGSYSKQGTNIIGGNENIIASIEINVIREVSKPTVMQLINQLQRVQGITDADKTDFSKSHPHLMFKNGITVCTWKNYVGVDHVFITDRSGKCVYGGYVGWMHSKYLEIAIKRLHEEFIDEIS